MNHCKTWKQQNQIIPKKQLDAFYIKVGKTIAEWLSRLECPDCTTESDLDWVLEPFSNGKPQFVCRHCEKRYFIRGLGFKKELDIPVRDITEKRMLEAKNQ